MTTTYKKPLTTAEQIDYLENTKRVRYIHISKEKAAEILYSNNYINVISPFKHYFAEKDSDKHPIKVNGSHVYSRNVDFKEYYNHYQNERNDYPVLYKSILTFEAHFNAIVSYETINSFGIADSDKFTLWIDSLKANLEASGYDDEVKQHMRSEIGKFPKQMDKYDSIYIFMDRLSLSALITVFRCSGVTLKKKIFKEMYSRNFTLGYTDLPTFESDLLERIVQIRNCVCHGNSLDVLKEYYDIKEKTFRTKSDKKRFKTIIRKLHQHNE